MRVVWCQKRELSVALLRLAQPVSGTRRAVRLAQEKATRRACAHDARTATFTLQATRLSSNSLPLAATNNAVLSCEHRERQAVRSASRRCAGARRARWLPLRVEPGVRYRKRRSMRYARAAGSGNFDENIATADRRRSPTHLSSSSTHRWLQGRFTRVFARLVSAETGESSGESCITYPAAPWAHEQEAMRLCTGSSRGAVPVCGNQHSLLHHFDAGSCNTMTLHSSRGRLANGTLPSVMRKSW
jgi:hypothetical protein